VQRQRLGLQQHRAGGVHQRVVGHLRLGHVRAVRATYLDTPLIPINIYGLSAMFAALLVISGTYTVIRVVRRKRYGCIVILILFSATMCFWTGIIYIFSWWPE
jgi:hypothetical protein